MKNIDFLLLSLSFIFLTLFSPLQYSLYSQPEVYNAIQYTQISQFEEDYSIVAMKMSGDGSKIIFSTGGPFVKIFTMNTDGSGLLQIYDFETTGIGPFVDINVSGEKVIWCYYGRLFIANSDGSARKEIATLLPNPNPDFTDFAPDIPLPPRITDDGTQVYFVVRNRDPLAAGIWRVNDDGSNIYHVLDYMEVSQQIFGSDGSEFGEYLGFTDGFDISGNGSRFIFGTRTIKNSEGDITRGHAIAFDGGDLHNLGEFAGGVQPFCTYTDGDHFIIFRLELNSDLQEEVINVYFVPLGTGDQIKVVSDVNMFGSAVISQMASNGNVGIIMGGNARLPLTKIDRVTSSRLDLVSFDGVSRAISGFDFSESAYPSMNYNGDKFCLLSNSIPRQIWIGELSSSGIDLEPAISQINFEPNYVVKNKMSTSHIQAHVSSPPNTIHAVSIETFIKGVHQFRGIDASGNLFFPFLYDDGTLGDDIAGDNYFNNNTVQDGVPETPIGEYTIRVAAVNSTLREISVVDAGPFYIHNEDPTTVNYSDNLPIEYSISQNYPNPFNPTTTISYSLPSEGRVRIVVSNSLGEQITELINEYKIAGRHFIDFNAGDYSSGVYYYQIQVEDFIKSKKMIILK